MKLLEDGESMNYELEKDMDKIQEEVEEKDLQNNYKIKITLMSEQNYSTIDDINLDRIRVQRKLIRSKGSVLQVIC